MAVITISAEYGTESEKVASLAAEQLKYEFVGDKMVSLIAKELNISESEAKIFSQTAQSKLLRFVDRYTCSIIQKVVDREHGCLDDDSYYRTTRKLVEKLYEADNVVILGWGGQCILRGKPNTLHVRLIQQPAAKIKSAMARKKVDEAGAREWIEKEERDMAEYIRIYFKEDWNDARLYDLIVDMGKHTPEQAAAKIADYLCRSQDT